jgi:hypothetical protein
MLCRLNYELITLACQGGVSADSGPGRTPIEPAAGRRRRPPQRLGRSPSAPRLSSAEESLRSCEVAQLGSDESPIGRGHGPPYSGVSQSSSMHRASPRRRTAPIVPPAPVMTTGESIGTDTPPPARCEQPSLRPAIRRLACTFRSCPSRTGRKPRQRLRSSTSARSAVKADRNA